jgi:Glycosyl hydrolases family 43
MVKAERLHAAPHPWLRRVGRSFRIAAAVILAVALLLAASLLLGGSDVKGSSSPPPPTATPRAPGIAIASRPYDLPDPMLLTVNGTYHLYVTTAFGDSTGKNVPELIGRPGHWTQVVDAMPKMPRWARPGKDDVWDPNVQKIGTGYVMYFSARLAHPSAREVALNSNGTHCLGVARSTNATGPFVPVGTQPILCQPADGGDIDVQSVDIPNGPDGAQHPRYLIWKSDNNNLRHPTLSGIWSAPLSDDGLKIAGTPRVIYQGRKAWEQPVLEAPQLVMLPNGSTWLFFSSGTGFFNNRYGMGVAPCKGPLGPCYDSGSKQLVSTNHQGLGPGEETAFWGPDGSLWLLYSPWHTAMMDYARPVEAIRIGWNTNGPYVAEAGTFPPP